MTEPRTRHCLLAFLSSRFLSHFCLRVEFCSNPEQLWVERAQLEKFLYFSLILWIYNNFKIPSASKVSYEATVFLNFLFCISVLMGLPGGSVVKTLRCRRPGLDPWVGGGHGNLLQFSSLESPMDRGAWRSLGSQRTGHNWRLSTNTQSVVKNFSAGEQHN